MMTIFLSFLTAAALAAAVFTYHKASETLKKTDVMLDAAIDGDFTEQNFSEEQLSRIETKLYRYLSEQETQKRQLETERENISRLIGDISHQTRTPLANVLLYTQLLAESDTLDSREHALAEKTAEQTEKLSFLITSLVKTSRLENNVIQLHPQRESVNELLSALEESYADKAAATGKTLTVQRATDTCAACFDRKWTLEAAGNLLDNAIKYTKAGGTICVSASVYEMFVRIDVSDNGIGIAEAEQAQVFGRFYRSPSVSNEEGVGIGLYLAREIITKEGGYIKLRSEEGVGSCFSVFLPKQFENLTKLS